MLLDDRRARRVSWRAHASELGVPHSTLRAFCTSIIPLGEQLKAGIARRYPQLTPLLAELSLAWMQRHKAVGVLPAPDQPQEAPR